MLRKTVLDPMIPEEEFAAASPLRRRPLITVAVIVILLAAGIFLGAKFSGMPSENSPYSAVYLTTGDVYFGKPADLAACSGVPEKSSILTPGR